MNVDHRKKNVMTWTAGLVVILTLAGCATHPSVPTPTPSHTQTQTQTQTTAIPTATPAQTPAPAPTPADPLAGMSLEQKVGQLFVVGTSVHEATAATVSAVSEDHIGGVFLHGRSSADVPVTVGLVADFTTAAGTSGPPLWVSTDPNGGEVQVLNHNGFDPIPSALHQADDDATLRAHSAAWAQQLRQAGVNLNLGPVADIVAAYRTVLAQGLVSCVSNSLSIL